MVSEKRPLSVEELESQTALALPQREMLGGLINVVLLNGFVIQAPVAVAANLCGVQAQVLTILSQQYQDVTCKAGAGSKAILVK